MKIGEVLQAKFESSQLKAVVNVKYTANFLSSVSTKFMAPFGLSMAQFNILRILRGAGNEMPVNTIKERMVEKSPNTTRLLDKLIDKDLISRERCENDRRVIYVKITKDGLALLNQIDKAMKKNEMFPENLTDEEAEQLSNLLDKLRGNVKN